MNKSRGLNQGQHHIFFSNQLLLTDWALLYHSFSREECAGDRNIIDMNFYTHDTWVTKKEACMPASSDFSSREHQCFFFFGYIPKPKRNDDKEE